MHQQSINNFLDTMKQQYDPNSRHKHQIGLFENLENELKSIIEAFNNERQQKRREIDMLQGKVKKLEKELVIQK